LYPLPLLAAIILEDEISIAGVKLLQAPGKAVCPRILLDRLDLDKGHLQLVQSRPGSFLLVLPLPQNHPGNTHAIPCDVLDRFPLGQAAGGGVEGSVGKIFGRFHAAPPEEGGQLAPQQFVLFAGPIAVQIQGRKQAVEGLSGYSSVFRFQNEIPCCSPQS
jgi:hypothetical protein